MLGVPGHWMADLLSTGSTFMYSYPFPALEPEAKGGQAFTGELKKQFEIPWESSRVPDSSSSCSTALRQQESVLDCLIDLVEDAEDEFPRIDGGGGGGNPHDLTPQRNLDESGSNVASASEVVEIYKGVEGGTFSGGTEVEDLSASCLSHPNLWRHDEAPKCQIYEDNIVIVESIYDSHDMVAGQSSACKESQDLSEELLWDIESDNNVLQSFRCNRRNLVLDSVYPHLAPHIVITPTEDTWDDYYLPMQNRVGPQWSDCLMVPPCILPSEYLPPSVDSSADIPWNNSLIMNGNECHTTYESYRPRAVFKHSEFHRFIEMSSTERLILYHVVIALRRHQYKAAAFSASGAALVFRKRYDFPDFVHSLEKPFEWFDPAEVLLSNSRYHLGTMVIDSVCPFRAPHIIINAPPPQSPWIPWQNATNNPQDCGYGNTLVVPSRSVAFVNRWSKPWENDHPSPSTLPEPTPDSFEPPSQPDTPALDTPVDDEPGWLLNQDASHVDDFSGWSSQPSLIDLILPSFLSVAESLQPSCQAFVEDEEDDLPPFDDWYLNNVKRTQILVM